jgi:hypothetical protein
MHFKRLAHFAAVATVTAFVSAAAVPAFADNCGNGRGNGVGNGCKGSPSGSVAPMPALGTGLPGLMVLVGGLILFARRRRN